LTGIERLNACFKAFPEETKALLHHMIPCPSGMEDHVVHREMPDGTKIVTLIGLLNGTLFHEGNQLGFQVTKFHHDSRKSELSDIQGYAMIPASKFVRKAPDGSGACRVAVVDPFNEVSP